MQDTKKSMLKEKQLCKRCGSEKIGTAIFTSCDDGSREISQRCFDCGTLLEFICKGDEKFCATEEQHKMVFSYAPYLSSGKSYDCALCDHFQIS